LNRVVMMIPPEAGLLKAPMVLAGILAGRLEDVSGVMGRGECGHFACYR
jgi:hypothetical protein